MKKVRLLVVLFSLISISVFSQTLYLSENFDYGTTPNTDITAVTSNWVLHSGTQPPQYVYPGLSYASYDLSGIGGAIGFTYGSSGTNDGDVHAVFSDSLATDGNMYVSFLLNLSSAKTGDYFFHLGPRNLGTTFRGRVYAKAGTTGWLAGLSMSSGGTGGTYDTTELNFNQTYLVVLKYSYSTAATDDDSVSLFVYDTGIPTTDPGSPIVNIGPLGGGTDASDIGSVAIRQSSNCPTGTIDGIQVTNYWPFANSSGQPTIISIDSARNSVNDTVTVTGVVISPNFRTTDRSYFIYDGTAGINLYRSGMTSPDLQLGDSVVVTGKIINYYSTIEIEPFADTNITVVGTNAVLPKPKIITVKEFNTNGENYQGQLIGFTNLDTVSGTWPTSSKNATFTATDGFDTLTIYLDSDMGLNNDPEPAWPADVEGIGALYSSSGNITYELYPRYITDFMAVGTLPVELSAFTAEVMQRSVVLNWKTATEINNSGFNVERSTNGKTFQKIAFIRGKGTTSEKSSYSFTDNALTNGSYFYRLGQVDFDGTTKYSKVIEVKVSSAPAEFELMQNYPNPFNPSTTIKFTLDKPGVTTLKIFNTLGQEIATLFNSQADAGHVYSINFNALNLASGIYFYQLKQGSQIQTHKMLLMK